MSGAFAATGAQPCSVAQEASQLGRRRKNGVRCSGARVEGRCVPNDARGARQIEHVVDINPYRVGKYLPGTGQRIVAPAFLRDYRPDNVVIMNPVYRDEVGRELAGQRCEATVYTILDLKTDLV
jgi:hypothetical protein